MPADLACFGCVTVLNDRYVLLFGGTDEFKLSDDIWIYCVQDQSFRKSLTKCPKEGTYDAESICDRNKDKCVTFGFVRDCWSKCKMNDSLFPPEYLIRIMFKYYWVEYIHLFDLKRAGHWKIDVFDIIDQLTQL